MARISRTQTYILIGGGGIVILVLLYRYYQSQSAGSNTSADQTAANGELGAIGSQLGGQEQSDVAALNNSLGNLQSQEQSDIGAIASQEAGDVSGLQQTLDTMGGQLGTLSNDVANIATGQKVVPRNSSVVVRRGSGFDRYYKAVTGKSAPAHIDVSNFILQAWRSHVPAARLKTLLSRHPAAHSPSHAANRPSTHETKPRVHGHPATQHASSTHANGGAAAPKTKPRSAPKTKGRKRGHR